MIRAIIFDFDGVIVDSVGLKSEAFYEIYSKYGSNIKTTQMQKMNLDFILVKNEYNVTLRKNYAGKTINNFKKFDYVKLA